MPIADSLDATASVLRANGHELAGDLSAADRALRELKDPRFPSPTFAPSCPSADLCAQSGPRFEADVMRRAARRAADGASTIGSVVGAILGGCGVVAAIAGLLGGGPSADASAYAPIAIGGALLVAGPWVLLRARARGRHAAWLRTQGLSLRARIVSAEPTGTTINDVPRVRLTFDVTGPDGAYRATCKRLMPSNEAASCVGHHVRIRANPGKLDDVVLED